jgi:hypothetical protein
MRDMPPPVDLAPDEADLWQRFAPLRRRRRWWRWLRLVWR